MAKEQWKPAPGYEGRYRVSNQGHVQRIGAHRELRPHVQHGHATVKLNDGTTRRGMSVARLILTAFKGEPAPGQVARHLNGDTTDNRLTNLAWGTLSATVTDSVQHGRHHNANKNTCKRGHALAGENLLQRADGRTCRACRNAGYRVRRAGNVSTNPELMQAESDRLYRTYTHQENNQ